MVSQQEADSLNSDQIVKDGLAEANISLMVKSDVVLDAIRTAEASKPDGKVVSIGLSSTAFAGLAGGFTTMLENHPFPDSENGVSITVSDSDIALRVRFRQGINWQDVGSDPV